MVEDQRQTGNPPGVDGLLRCNAVALAIVGNRARSITSEIVCKRMYLRGDRGAFHTIECARSHTIAKTRRLPFTVRIGRRNVELVIELHPGDAGEAVAAIMLPSED